MHVLLAAQGLQQRVLQLGLEVSDDYFETVQRDVRRLLGSSSTTPAGAIVVCAALQCVHQEPSLAHGFVGKDLYTSRWGGWGGDDDDDDVNRIG